MGRGAWGSKGLQELDTTQQLNHHKFHGQRSLGSYRPLSRKELDMTEHTPEWHECLWPAWYRMRVSLIGRANSKGVASLELCFSDIYVTKMLFAVLWAQINQTHPSLSLQAILPWRLWDLILDDRFSTPSLEALLGCCPGLQPPSLYMAGRTGSLSTRLGDDCHKTFCRAQ